MMGRCCAPLRSGLSIFLFARRAAARSLVAPLALTVGAVALVPAVPVAAQSATGGFVEAVTEATVRSVSRPTLPERGKFSFPAPYNTVGARLTNAGDCGGQDCVNYVGYSYWRNTNNHVNSDTMLIVITLDRARGGGGPTLFSYNKTTDAVTNAGPLFDSASPFSWDTGEGWYFSATQPTTLYVSDAQRLYRFDVNTKQMQPVFDVTSLVSAGAYLWQTHSSDDDRVHSATVLSSDWAQMGCVVYREDTRQTLYVAREGDYDECQIDKSGRWLLIKEQLDGSNGEDNLIIDVTTGNRVTFLDQQGAAGHSDSGFGYMIAEDNWNASPGAVRVWRFDQPFPTAQPGTPPQGTLVYHTTDWAVSAGHISHANARSGVPVEQQFACASNATRASLPRANEIVCFRLDGSMQILVVAPVMTDLNAAGGGSDDYAKMPKGNLDVTGQYFIWTSNAGTDRLDAFVVKVPAQLLGGETPTSPPPAEPAPAPAPAPTDASTVTWTDVVNAVAQGGSLRKSGGCDGCADAGAVTTQVLTSKNGALEFTVSETTTLRAIGLSASPRGTAINTIRFAFTLQPNGIAEIREYGTYRADTPVTAGDVLKIAVESGVVRYYRNGQVIYTSRQMPGSRLWGDAALLSAGATLSDVKFQGAK